VWLSRQPEYVQSYVRALRPESRNYYVQRGPTGWEAMARKAKRLHQTLDKVDRFIDEVDEMLDR
jgi:hypothetical protein